MESVEPVVEQQHQHQEEAGAKTETTIKTENNTEDNTNRSPSPAVANENNGVKQAIYDVLGSNDQELARRQYDDVDDDDDSDTDNGPLTKRKRLALGYDDSHDEHGNSADAANGTATASTTTTINGGNARGPVDENCLSNSSSSVNGYRSDFNSSLDSTGGGGDPSTTSVTDGGQEGKRSSSATCSSDEPEQMRKLFIGGLDYKTSEETLKQHFEKFGDVNDCVVMREPQSKRSRGFGFVLYAHSSMVDRAQYARPHEVDGREVQSKRAISREDSGKPEAQATVKKAYLGGLSDDIEESDVREYFKEFGNIVNISIPAHKDTGKRRGFAFVEFDDYDSVDKIVLKKFHTIKERRIEAKKAIPKVDMDAARRPGRNGGGSSAYLWGSGTYNCGGYPPANYPANYGYSHHYHSPSAHYGAETWMMHGAQAGAGGSSSAGPYGLRGAHVGGFYGRNGGYSNPPAGPGAGSLGVGASAGAGAGYASPAADYGIAGYPAPIGGAAVGPMRVSYQHRGLGPYGTGYGSGAHRGRG